MSNPRKVFPPVSILKPLKGTDPDIYESFRSHCLQDYPEYEIIFGVSDADDPAVASVQQLQREFPERAIRLVVCSQKLGANVKVSNLEQMLPAARYQHLLVNDSDIRVERDYLRRVIAPLMDEHIGMVTCLYRGVPASTSDHDWKRSASARISAPGCWLLGNSKVEFALAWVRLLPFDAPIWRELAGFDRSWTFSPMTTSSDGGSPDLGCGLNSRMLS